MNQETEKHNYSFDDFPDEIKIGVLSQLDFSLDPGSFIALQLSSKSIEYLSKTDRGLQKVWFAQFTDFDEDFDDYYVPGLFFNYYKLVKDTSAKGRENLLYWLDKQRFQRLIDLLGFKDEY